MAGGTWTVQNKTRPGVYVNTKSAPKALGSLGERGVVSMPLTLSWGQPKVIVAIEAGENTASKLGYDISAPQLLLVREALKRAKKLLLYRVNAGTKATATSGSLTATAKWGGVRGNDLSIVIQTNVDENTKFDVITKLEGTAVNTQTVANITGLIPNAWIDWSGTGSLATTAGAPLVGGADGTAAIQDYSDYLAALEIEDFNTIGLPVTTSTIKSAVVAFVKRLREDEGKKIVAVLENYPAADYEGVISVKNGVVLDDGTTLTAAQATAWTAGATAGANVNESLTYAAYEGAVDVSPRYTNSQIVAALRAGEFLFTPSKGKAVVEQDINTLTGFSPEKGKMFAKNRVVRVLDGISNDFVRIFSGFYLGKVSNNAAGRNLLKGECINYLDTLQGIEAVQNFDSQTDITVSAGADSDAVLIETNVQPVDSIEKIYVAVTVS
ncbi:phage tail sheath family protein [Cohnella nanjingensis]|uniref:Phage tail sheath family protein n=1 Tax=Cohnella nanjingensis TaxID=1387779 RepID=A0A7X0RQ89_9BACL|nr:phage tail sheath family protein [Cohnella nanjingensis]MBB6670279.1 phage tail sheath family protein [Cohnella nanjingensis]